jgi:7-cyano-7-deazaguanine synthase
MPPEQPSKAVVLLSGGIDSTTLLVYLCKRLCVPEVRAISFRYGQKHSREVEMAEWQASRAGVAEHRVVEAPQIGALTHGGSALTDDAIEVPTLEELSEKDKSQPPTYVPNRNMMLLSMAAAYAESSQTTSVYYGAQAQDEYGYWDCTVEFLERINSALALNRRNAVQVEAPFMSWRKADIIRLGDELGVDYDFTWTCYRGETEPCGRCPSCVERGRAFAEAREEQPM